MARDVIVETRGDRTALAADAGFGRISLGSVLAGTLVAYGAFAVLLAVAAAVIKAVGINTDVSTNQWHQMGAGAAAAVAVVLFVSYLYGGYVAGRMARRSGMTNGLLVFFLSIVIAVGVTAFARWMNTDDVVLRNLRNIGVPTSRSEWSYIGTIAGIASLAAMLLGCVVGGTLGERWHGKLLTRAWDPEVGDGVPVAAGTRHVVDDGQTVMTRRRDANTTDRTDTTDSTLDEDYAGERTTERSGERTDTTMFAGPTID